MNLLEEVRQVRVSALAPTGLRSAQARVEGLLRELAKHPYGVGPSLERCLRFFARGLEQSFYECQLAAYLGMEDACANRAVVRARHGLEVCCFEVESTLVGEMRDLS